MNEYIPGVCNIGKKERGIRRNIGFVGLFISIFYILVIAIFDLNFIFKSFIFVPVFLSFISFLQYKMHFCAEFGILGKYNFKDELGNPLSVEQQEYLKLDRIKAIKIIIYSILLSLVVSALIVVLL